MPAQQAVRLIAKPLEQFLKIQAASGILLLICAVVAMVWANSPWQSSYFAIWHTHIHFSFGPIEFDRDLHFVINDILMVLFFFVVGLEIRRELHQGELSELRRASLPAAAALGGMVVPAAIYAAFNHGTPAAAGWGVPMATDIAFAVGVLALLGKRVPAALRVLLLALAIIDDIGAILVIAIFYSSGGDYLGGLSVVGAGVLGVVLLQRIGVRSPWAYVVPGFVVWLGFLDAGVHPTIAGVLLGLMAPVRSWFGTTGFIEEAESALDDFRHVAARSDHDEHDLVHALERIRQARTEALPPVVRLEEALNPWVAFGIMPLFALANAGVTVGAVDLGAAGATALATGVAVGLALGKPLGIVGFSLLAVALGLSTLPRGVDAKGLIVVGLLGGIGFTMALFIGQLAFSDAASLGVAKLAVLVASAVTGILGLVVGWLMLPVQLAGGATHSVDLAERSTDL